MGATGAAVVYGASIFNSETVYRRSPQPDVAGPMVEMKFCRGANSGMTGNLATVTVVNIPRERRKGGEVLVVVSYCYQPYLSSFVHNKILRV